MRGCVIIRLIDVDKFLIDESEAYISTQNRINDSLTRKVNLVVHKKIQKLIADAPTVDAVEVVRCKDCKWQNGTACPMFDWWTPEGIDEFFCRFGERKTE